MSLRSVVAALWQPSDLRSVQEGHLGTLCGDEDIKFSGVASG